MDLVKATHEEITISKRGKPVAKLIPIDPEPTRPLFGFLKNTVTIENDIISPTGEVWNAGQ
jgi:antitoxin (DNA-binding transcriptional repressor) of toxin-antitoxin stability system